MRRWVLFLKSKTLITNVNQSFETEAEGFTFTFQPNADTESESEIEITEHHNDKVGVVFEK